MELNEGFSAFKVKGTEKKEKNTHGDKRFSALDISASSNLKETKHDRCLLTDGTHNIGRLKIEAILTTLNC